MYYQQEAEANSCATTTTTTSGDVMYRQYGSVATANMPSDTTTPQPPNSPGPECYICRDDTSPEPLLRQTCQCQALVHRGCIEKLGHTKCTICHRNFHVTPPSMLGVLIDYGLETCKNCYKVVVAILSFFIILGISWLLGWLLNGKSCDGDKHMMECMFGTTFFGVLVLFGVFSIAVFLFFVLAVAFVAIYECLIFVIRRSRDCTNVGEEHIDFVRV